MLSAGSGGTVFLSASKVIASGLSYFSAAGGNSINGNGSGAGGLVKVSFAE